MTFPDPIDPSSPSDSDLLSLGDDAIRKLARAVSQIFDALLVDRTVNPPKLKASAYEDGTIPKSALVTTAGIRTILFGDGDFGPISSFNPGDTITTTISVPGAATGDVAVITDQGNDRMRTVITRVWAGPDSATVEITNPPGAPDPLTLFFGSFRVAVIKYT